MITQWQHQLRIYLPEALAEKARQNFDAPELQPLASVLAAHQATPVSQLDAFETYVGEAEQAGSDNAPLYKWTKATLADPEKRRKHLTAFALHVAGQDVYSKETADQLEAALQPLIEANLITHLTRHDTNPATNLPIPPQYRP